MNTHTYRHTCIHTYTDIHICRQKERGGYGGSKAYEFIYSNIFPRRRLGPKPLKHSAKRQVVTSHALRLPSTLVPRTTRRPDLVFHPRTLREKESSPRAANTSRGAPIARCSFLLDVPACGQPHRCPASPIRGSVSSTQHLLELVTAR